MSDTRIESIAPRGIVGYRAFLVPASGEGLEVTDIVSEISIYESIFSPFLYGDILLVDDIEAFSSLPIRSQEELTVIWERDEEKVIKTFYITDVYDINTTNNTVATYGMSFTSKNQMINATSLFSKAYHGKASKIIEEIYEEFFSNEPELEIETHSKTSHNIVFPFMKPFQAIDLIKQSVLGDDNSPLFLFETLYGEKLVLSSLKKMFSHPTLKLDGGKSFATITSGATQEKSTADQSNHRGQFYEQNITGAFDMLQLIRSGALASYSSIVDPSRKVFKETDFSLEGNAPFVWDSFVDPEYEFGEEKKNTRNMVLKQNKRAFDSNEWGNINGTSPHDKLILMSYMKRLTNTFTIKAHMDSVAFYLEGDDDYFGVGKTIDFDIAKFTPHATGDTEHIDEPNSGKYLISSLRHYIKDDDYTMSVELIREGLNPDA